MSAPEVPPTQLTNMVSFTPDELDMITQCVMTGMRVASTNMRDQALPDEDKQYWRKRYDTCMSLFKKLNLA